MGVEALDAMVLHNPSLKTLARGEAWTALRDLKTAGKVRLIGMSVGSEDVGRAALIRKPDLVVLPYNLFVPAMLHRLSSEISSSGAGVGALSAGLRAPRGWLVGRAALLRRRPPALPLDPARPQPPDEAARHPAPGPGAAARRSLREASCATCSPTRWSAS
ncbi:MAG: aldo/keto reductase [Deltaproteobacteria bacterium]|nr:aldo/keto reductase [Deltaproteobacteria bacterium]